MSLIDHTSGGYSTNWAIAIQEHRASQRGYKSLLLDADTWLESVNGTEVMISGSYCVGGPCVV